MRFSPFLALALAGCTVTGQTAAPPEAPLHADAYGVSRPAQVRTLVFVVNGDGAPGERTDEQAFARTVAAAVPDSAVLAVLRPGHRDALGHASPGNPGAGIGDDLAPLHLDALARTVAAWKARYPKARTLIVGDSGGAALAADLAGLRPEAVDGMVLVGCPCALPEWRSHMAQRTANRAWRSEVDSLDPLHTVGGIKRSLRAAILVGSDDPITPVQLSRAYAEALALRGIATDFHIVPGKGHDLLGDPETLAVTVRIAAALGGQR